MPLDEICENVRQLSFEHGWDQVDTVSRMLHVTAEVGEVADAVISLQSTPEAQVGAAQLALGHEIFDAIWNLCALANASGVDIERAARDKWPSTPNDRGQATRRREIRATAACAWDSDRTRSRCVCQL